MTRWKSESVSSERIYSHGSFLSSPPHTSRIGKTVRPVESEKSKRYFRSRPSYPPLQLSSLPPSTFSLETISRNPSPPSLPSPPLSGSRFISHNRFAKVEGSMFGSRDENRYGRKETFDFFYRATSTRQLSTREASRSAAQFYVIPYLADTSGSGGLARRHDASWRANEGEFG